MDHESLIAGLLHDTVEDTENVKFEEIEVSLQQIFDFPLNWLSHMAEVASCLEC